MTDALLGRQILEYLVKQPEAKDTLEGIMDWWLPATHPRARLEELERVLKHLVKRKWVTVTEAGPLVVYGLDQERLGEIKAYLQGDRKA